MARKSQAQADPQADTQLEFPVEMFGMHMPPDPREANPDTTPKPDASQPQMVTISKEQLDELLAAQRDGIRDILTGAGPRQPQPGSPAVEPTFELDLNGLPDPAQDREGFLKGFAERTGKMIGVVRKQTLEDARNTATDVATQQRVVTEAWQDLSERYDDVAPYKAIVKAVADDYAAELRAKGVDPGQEIMSNTTRYVDEVGKRTRSMVAELRGEASDNDAPPEASRTGGIITDRANGTGRGTRAPQRQQTTSFIDEIKTLQAKSKIY